MLNHADIARRIPHQGRMCLLARVLAWDAGQIDCEADNHAAPDHPLRAHGRLGIACGIEYAAQAMAVHGALLAGADGGAAPADERPRVGYLASVRNVQLHADRLDDVAGALHISAQRLLGEAQHIVYGFELKAAGRMLIAGRAAVVLDAGMAARLSMGVPT